MADISGPGEQLRGEGQPTRDRKTYRTLKHAESVCAYLNDYGQHRDRYFWAPTLREDNLYELLRFDRPPRSR